MSVIKYRLEAARALISDPKHWAKNEYVESGSCYCALGALGMVASGVAANFLWEDREALLMALPVGVGSVVEFNDAVDTTHADIMDLFQRAIDAQDDQA